jgi:tetrapyrrole methylase family protein/MazG family protein
MATDETKPGDAYKSLYDIIARLRGPGGCPWDREQNPSTLRGDLIEETYECIEAIDENDPAHIREELGDIFLLVTLLAYIHEESDVFSVAGVLQTACDKLVRRHPHVFGETKVNNSAEVISNWDKIKVEQEGRKPRDSVLDEVSSGLPPLDRAWKLQKKRQKPGLIGLTLKAWQAKYGKSLPRFWKPPKKIPAKRTLSAIKTRVAIKIK